LGSELQEKKPERENLLAFLKRIDYTSGALGLSFYFRKSQKLADEIRRGALLRL
jgi:hypothetical protein